MTCRQICNITPLLDSSCDLTWASSHVHQIWLFWANCRRLLKILEFNKIIRYLGLVRHRFTVILIILSLLSATAAQAAGHCLMMPAGMLDTMTYTADANNEVATGGVATKAANVSENHTCHEIVKQANPKPNTSNAPSADVVTMDCCSINMTDCQCVQGCSVAMLFVALATHVADDPSHSAALDRDTLLWIDPTLAGLYRPPIAAA